MPRFIDLTGQRFHRLVVVAIHARATRTPPRHNTLWLCRCDCGTQCVVDGANLGTPRMRSCGCLRQERQFSHGHAIHGRVTPTYFTWTGLWQRCSNPRHPGYKNWGGRGITVCDRWQTFENFLADMGPKPPDHSIERIDNDGNYEPSNCIWIPKSEQWKNKRHQGRYKKLRQLPLRQQPQE